MVAYDIVPPDAAGYEEFSLLHENASEAGLEWTGPPVVRRIAHRAPSGHRLSGLLWGEGEPEAVLVHGGMQNAHTWDTVALALGRPLLALDLPGHGHSDWRGDKAYHPQAMADDVGATIEAVAGSVRLVVGMSLGGLTSSVVVAERAELAQHLALVDITPGVTRAKASDIIDFVQGPEVFDSFDALLERTMAFNPTRSEPSLRRGILHNARPRPDGTWEWRYDLPVPRHLPDDEGSSTVDAHRFADLWDALEAAATSIVLYQGSRSPVVDDTDVAELTRRRPDARHVVIDDAGHSIQGDQPVVLAHHLAALLDS